MEIILTFWVLGYFVGMFVTGIWLQLYIALSSSDCLEDVFFLLCIILWPLSLFIMIMGSLGKITTTTFRTINETLINNKKDQ